MKNEPKVKKLVLRKETLRDLSAQNAGQVKGGAKTNGKKCVAATQAGLTCGVTCPTYYAICTNTCWGCYSYYGCW